MAFSDEVYRWDEGHAASAAAFLADATNKVSVFSVQLGESDWSPQTDNTVDGGEQFIGLNAVISEIGNDILSPWKFVGRTSRQVKWMLDNRFSSGGRSEEATVGVYDQDRNAWTVYTCIANWRTENSINNKYRDVIITFSAASELA
jgi:hypothetical protein